MNANEQVLEALKDGPMSRRELESTTGLPLMKALKEMRKQGIVTTIGQKRGTKYALPNGED